SSAARRAGCRAACRPRRCGRRASCPRRSVRRLLVATAPRPLDLVPHLLAGAELQALVGRDEERLAVGGVDAGAAGAGDDLEDAEVLDAHRPAIEERRLHGAEHLVHHLSGLLLGERAVTVVDTVHQVGLGLAPVARCRQREAPPLILIDPNDQRSNDYGSSAESITSKATREGFGR